MNWLPRRQRGPSAARPQALPGRQAWAAVVVVLVLGAGLSACSSSSPATSTTPPKAHSANVTASCAQRTGYVECDLPSDYTAITMSSLLSSASAIDSTVSGSTPMIITAFGGPGGDSADGGGFGASGEAQTTTTEITYTQQYGNMLYYFIGDGGGTPGPEGGTGGAATLVSFDNLAATAPCVAAFGSCTSTMVPLITGGGGRRQGQLL